MSADNEISLNKPDQEVPTYFAEKDLEIHTREVLSYKEMRGVLRVAEHCHQLVERGNSYPDTRLASPSFSNFYVQGAMGVVEHPEHLVELYNFEYGEGDALHGEETGGAQLRGIVGPSLKDKRTIVAFSGGGTPSSCGGCRDFMRETFSPRSLMTAVDSESRKIGVWRLKDLFYQVGDAHRVDIAQLPRKIARVIQKLEPDDFDRGGYWPYHNYDEHPEREYSAIMHVGNRVFKEYGYGPVDYRTTPPVQMLIQDILPVGKIENLKALHKPVDPANVCLYILGANLGITPDVVYKDRNQLLELEFRLAKLWDQADLAIPVAIVNLDANGQKEVHFTNSKDWLPDPFHPRILAG